MDIRSLSGPMELSDILDTPSPLIRVNACMYEYMPHMYIFVTALSNIPLIMLCMFPHGLYSLLDYEINLSYLILSYIQTSTYIQTLCVLCNFACFLSSDDQNQPFFLTILSILMILGYSTCFLSSAVFFSK